MRKISWIVSLLLSVATLANTQQQESIDSLETELEIELSEANKDSAKIAKLYVFLINDLILFNDGVAPEPYFYEGINYCKKDTCNYDLYNAMIRHYMATNNTDSIYKYSKELLKKLPKTPRATSLAYMGIASANSFEHNTDKAISYFRKAIEEGKKTRDEDWILSVQMNLASVFYSTGNIDSALNIYKVAVTRFEDIAPNEHDVISTIYTNIGTLYFRSNTDSAIHYLKLSKKICEETNNYPRLALANYNLGMAYLILGKKTEAKLELENSLSLYKRLDNKTPQPKLYARLGALAANEGNLKAGISYLDSADKVYKMLNSESRTQALAEAETKFGLVEQELKNEILQEKEAKAEATINEQRIVVFAIFLILILTILLTIFQYRNKKTVQQLNLSLETKNKRLDSLVNEKDNLMGILVHDVRSPMSSISSAINLIESDKENTLSSISKEMFTEVSKTAETGLSLINSIWSVYSLENRLNEIEKSPLELEALLKNIKSEFTPIASSRKIEVIFDIQAIKINSNSTFLEMVFRNLISNALKFSPKNSNVWVETENNETHTIIKVRDQGPGFSEQDQQKIHNKFQRLSAKPLHGEKSSGLGLYLVKLICDQLNINIELNKNYKHGAEFLLSIPR